MGRHSLDRTMAVGTIGHSRTLSNSMHTRAQHQASNKWNVSSSKVRARHWCSSKWMASNTSRSESRTKCPKRDASDRGAIRPAVVAPAPMTMLENGADGCHQGNAIKKDISGGESATPSHRHTVLFIFGLDLCVCACRAVVSVGN